MTYEKPLPKLNSDSRPFWEACRTHVLKLQQCAACGFVRWPPSFLCPSCHSAESRWIPASGLGKVHSHVVYHVAYHPGFVSEIPYVVAAVRLAEGPLFLSNIVGCDPDRVCCGMDVTLAWDDVSPEISLPKFRPLE